LAKSKNEVIGNKVQMLKMQIGFRIEIRHLNVYTIIEESFRLKKQSEHLLELAKRAVEVAVEEGEERGMGLLINSRTSY